MKTAIPKIKYEYSITLNGALKSMGMPTAFGLSADFTAMGDCPSGSLFIGKVNHKAYIALDERGTKAGAATSVGIGCTGSGPYGEYTVTLDRPFVFALIDNATGLPVFMGAVLEV